MRYNLLNDKEELSKYLFSFCVEVYVTIAVIGTWAFYYIAGRTAVQLGIFTASRDCSIHMPNPLMFIDYLDAVIMETMRVRPIHGVIPLVCQANSYRLTDSQDIISDVIKRKSLGQPNL